MSDPVDEVFGQFRGSSFILDEHQVPQEMRQGPGLALPTGFVDRLRNRAGNVLIDDNGITLDAQLGAAITIKNSSGVVVIDGSSEIFSILVSGTASVEVLENGNAETATTLTALGNFTETPAHLSYIAEGNSTNSNQFLGFFATLTSTKWVAQSSGGTSDWDVDIFQRQAGAFTDLVGAGPALSRMTVWGFNRGADTTFYLRYYILNKTAL